MQKLTAAHAARVNEFIVGWLKDYADNANVDGFVVGISGGIDSAVTSTLCAQTGKRVLCVEMPIYQAESHVDRGREHIEQLKRRFPNVGSVETDLTEVFDVLQTKIKKDTNEASLHLSLANTRARLRMTTLYYYAGIYNLLVGGTGNKVEDFGVGFYTKYGDGGVDVSPIADLVKSEVFELGRYLKVPESILTATPTDGLFGDERTDEQQIGASYDELEWAMAQDETGRTETDFEGRERVVFGIYKRLNRNNRHKMEPIPVCLIPRALRE